MFKKLLITAGIVVFSLNAFASRGRVEVKVSDLKDARTREVKANEVKDSIKDIVGSEKLAESISAKIKEAERLDSETQQSFTNNLNAFMRGLESYSRSTSKDEAILSKAEDVVVQTLDAAFSVKANSPAESVEAKDIAEVLFTLAGQRLKEKLENTETDYSMDKMERAAQIVMAKLGRRSVNEAEIKEVYNELLQLFNAKDLKDVIKCKA